MKKFWISIGKAAAYFAGYLGTQMGVSLVISTIVSTIVSISMVQPDGSFDMEAYMSKATEAVGAVMYYILIISGLITILIFWIVAKIRKKKFAQSASLKKFAPASVAPIVIGGIAFNFAISYLMGMIPFPQSWIDSYQASSNELLGGTGIAMWISVVIMAPIVEEFTFRGFIYTRLKQGMAKWIAVILTSIVFPYPIICSSIELSSTSFKSTYIPSSEVVPSPNFPIYIPGRRRMCSFQSNVTMFSSW